MGSAAAYSNLIRDFCAASGIPGWAEVVGTQHVALGERLVGLVPGFDGARHVLSVFIELGPSVPERDGPLYERLLAANLHAGVGMRGHYAIHSESKQALYCMCFPLHEVKGEDLARIVEQEFVARGLEAAALSA